MKSTLLPFLAGAMVVLGIGIHMKKCNSMNQMMHSISNMGCCVADKFKGTNNKNCECDPNCNCDKEQL